MKTTYQQHTVEVCDTCIYLAANGRAGSDITDEEHAAFVKGLHTWEGNLPQPISDDEGNFASRGFLWQPCDVCGSGLGGDRTTSIIYLKVSKGAQ